MMRIMEDKDRKEWLITGILVAVIGILILGGVAWRAAF
jgi:hypothetical protein